MKNEKPYLFSINIDFVFNRQTIILWLVSHRAKPTCSKPGTSKTGFGQVEIMKEFV